jgi:8-amino-7-oxononanoate synthase
MYQRLKELNFDIGPEASPIIAVRFESKEEAFAIWSGLLERGVYVNMVVPPATPDDRSLLRCSVSAGHTPEQMEHICNSFTELRERPKKAQTV